MNISVKNGSFYYKKGVQIFDDINFSVDSGEIMAILGPNGAGKTTMLRCITGMLKWRGGESLLDGEPIHTMPPKSFGAKWLTFLRQNQFPPHTPCWKPYFWDAAVI